VVAASLAPGAPAGATAGLSRGSTLPSSSAMWQMGQSPGASAVTSGCIGQTYLPPIFVTRLPSSRRLATQPATAAPAASAKRTTRATRTSDNGALVGRPEGAADFGVSFTARDAGSRLPSNVPLRRTAGGAERPRRVTQQT